MTNKKKQFDMKWLILVMVLILGVSLFFIEGDKSEQNSELGEMENSAQLNVDFNEITNENDTSEELVESSLEEVEEDDDIKEETYEFRGDSQLPNGRFDNPISLQSWMIYEDTYNDEETTAVLRARPTRIDRGPEVAQFIALTDERNEEAPDGMEWVIVHMEVELIDGSNNFPYTESSGIHAYDLEGIKIFSDSHPTVGEDDFVPSDGKLYPGDVYYGIEALQVPIGDEFLIGYSFGHGATGFFSSN